MHGDHERSSTKIQGISRTARSVTFKSRALLCAPASLRRFGACTCHNSSTPPLESVVDISYMPGREALAVSFSFLRFKMDR